MTQTAGTTATASGDGAGTGAQPSAASGAPQGVQAPQQPTAGTPAAGQLQATDAPVRIADLVKQYPHLKDEIEREFVSPHIQRSQKSRQQLETEIEQQVLSRVQTQQVQSQLTTLSEQAKSPDATVRNAALLKMGELRLAEHTQATSVSKQKEWEQARLIDLAKNVAQTVLKIDPATIPPEILADTDKFSEWAFDNSPRYQEKLKAALASGTADIRAVQTAEGQAAFGQALATTPSPSTTGLNGAPSSGLPMTQAEFDQNRRNPQWVRNNLPRLRSAMDAGAVTR
jgi:hypothetical protein